MICVGPLQKLSGENVGGNFVGGKTFTGGKSVGGKPFTRMENAGGNGGSNVEFTLDKMRKVWYNERKGKNIG